MRALLVGPAKHGSGEGAYMNLLRTHPPPGVSYIVSGGAHEGAEGAPCSLPWEVALNRLVRPPTIPDIGFRALRVRGEFDLVHVHAHPVRLAQLGATPLVMSEGSSSAVYLGEYLGWDDARIQRGYNRARRVYRALGLHDRLLAMERTAKVYVFSSWARDVNLHWGADPSKLEVVSPGFATPPEVQRHERETFTFLFVGGDFERKGGFDLVEAFDQVVRERPETRLWIVGSNPREPGPDWLARSWVSEERRHRVLSRLEALQRKGLVSVHGAVDQTTLRESLYPTADAFVMPTLAEGFGFTNVEALSYGIPVISTRVGPIPEIVAHEKTGVLVEPADVDALANAMRRLSADAAFARVLGANGRSDFRARYTVEHFRAGLEAVYRRALDA